MMIHLSNWKVPVSQLCRIIWSFLYWIFHQRKCLQEKFTRGIWCRRDSNWIRLCMRGITGYSAYDVRWANRQIEKRPGCFSAELVISVPLLSIGLRSILMITGFLGTSPAKACWTKLCLQSRKWFSLNKRMSHFYNTFKLSLLFPRRGRLSVCRNSHSSGMEWVG